MNDHLDNVSIKKKLNISLALGSDSARGLAHIGVFSIHKSRKISYLQN